MSYVVLARKWRPTQFNEVVGQGHIAKTLQNAIRMDRVAHAFLFTGARGVGKTSTARIMAKALNCRKEGPTPNPCGTCSSCLEVTEGRAVDVFEIDGASNRGINEIRELRESVRYAPSSERYKIYIIDEVHMLTTEAFNALLKTLEEPPPHAKFIFATTEPQKIPVTILSRCQRYDFKRISQVDIVSHLSFLCGEEKIEAEEDALKIIARQATGGMRDALSLLDQIISFSGDKITESQVLEILGVANRKHLFSLTDAIVDHDISAALQTIEDVDAYGYDLQQFTGEFIQHCRNMVVVASTEDPTQATDLTESEISSAQVTASKASIDLFHRMFSISSRAAVDMHSNTFPKVTLEMAVIQMTQLRSLVGLDLLIDRLRDLEQRFDNEAPKNIDRRADAQRVSRPIQASPKPLPIREPSVPAPQKAISVVPSEFKMPEKKREDPPQREVLAPENKEPENIETKALDGAPAPALPGRLDLLTIARLDPVDRWKRVVEALRYNRPLAMQCERGFVESFDEKRCVLSFEKEYSDFISSPEKLETIRKVVCALFGDLEFSATVVEEVELKEKNMAIERDEERQARFDTLTDNAKQHSAVRHTMDLFDVEEIDLQVEVRLFDD